MVHYGEEPEALDITNDDGNYESGSEAGDVMQLSKTTYKNLESGPTKDRRESNAGNSQGSSFMEKRDMVSSLSNQAFHQALAAEKLELGKGDSR